MRGVVWEMRPILCCVILLGLGIHTPILGLSVILFKKVRLFAYSMIKAKGEYRLKKTILFKLDWQKENLQLAISMVLKYARSTTREIIDTEAHCVPRGERVFLHKNWVHGEYNYKFYKTQPPPGATLIPGCQMFELVNKGFVIRYPHQKGTYLATNIHQFILRKILQLHSSNIVHGDIRLMNLIFQEDDAHLLNFDFSGPPDTTTYPQTFIKEVPEGRHPTAHRGAKLKFDHDLHGLGLILEKLFFPRCSKLGNLH